MIKPDPKTNPLAAMMHAIDQSILITTKGEN